MTDAPDKIWWSAAEIADAGLPDLPTTKRKVNERARLEGWENQPNKVRRRRGPGGGLEYHYSVLPTRARLALTLQRNAETKEPQRVDRTQAWANFERLTDKKKDKARVKHAVVSDVFELEKVGFTKTKAVSAVALNKRRGEKTIWNWLAEIEGVAEADWLAYLAPQQTGSRKRAQAIDPRFWEMVKSDFLRLSQPTLQSCYDRSVRVAEVEGIPVPPIYQVRRYLKATVSEPTQVYLRKGAEALRRYFPHQDRDKSALSAMECVCGDYHKFDVFVRWPGEDLPVRVQGVFFSDVYSGKLLAWRLSLTANSHTVMLALGDLIEDYGIPHSALLDNGREFASKVITGGAPTRFRFKIKDEDIPGLLPTLGVKVHWATPYSGQSKPIERAFRDLCDRVAKHPAFEGAYTGNKPDAKPENYGKRAVPLADFVAVLRDEVAHHNARTGRRSEIAYGRSFDEVFEASYKDATIRKATQEQRRLWLMGAEGLRASAKNGELRLHGSRYWSEWMYRIAGQKIVARFDPDNLHSGLHVYELDGRYIGHAACLERGDFLGLEDARTMARKRSQFIRATKAEAEAARNLEAAEIAARLRAAGQDVQADDLPEAKVVQLVPGHKNAAKPARPQMPAADAALEADLDAHIARLEDHRAPSHDNDPEANFKRWQELQAMDAEGAPLTQEQRQYVREYQKSAEYKGFLRMQQALGGGED